MDQTNVLINPALEQLVGMKLSTKERGGKRTERRVYFEVRRIGIPMVVSHFGKRQGKLSASLQLLELSSTLANLDVDSSLLILP